MRSVGFKGMGSGARMSARKFGSRIRAGGLLLFVGVVATAASGAPTGAPSAPTTSTEELGRLLFWDPILSGERDVSCATCHHPDFAYADGRALSLGVGAVGLGPERVDASSGRIPVMRRNSPTVINTDFNGLDRRRRRRRSDDRRAFDGTVASVDQLRAPMFWDNRVRSLEVQALEPLKTMEEMRGAAYPEDAAIDSVVARIQAIPQYASLFEDAFGTGPIQADQIASAIATFERSLVAMNSPFDRFQAGDTDALTEQQRRGREAFDDVGCDGCHEGIMFSDFDLRAEGVREHPLLTAPDAGDGRFRFRTPSLRNVALTAPYMHNGVLETLEDVLHFYDEGRFENPNVANGRGRRDERGTPRVDSRFRRVDDMSESEMRDIIAFLEALTDDDFDKEIPARVPSSGLPVGGLIGGAQTSNDPFSSPIAAADGVITVDVVEFASLPDVDGEPARMMLLVDEPETGRLFVNDMRGLLYGVSYDGQTVTRYLDLTARSWDLSIQASGTERGFQSFAFHPQFNQPGTPGFGKFYAYLDTSNTAPAPDFAPGGGDDAHDTILLEWTAGNPGAATYDGDPPRELFRVEQPFGNHNGGQIGFNPLAAPGDADFGLLYVGSADGGSGGDPLDLAQNLGVVFGKILRIDPLGSDSANGQYGVPAANPFAADGDAGTLGEIYAFGVRNPQRFGWDPANGNMFVADIGQNIVEEVSLVTSGANLGWNDWEGSFRFISRQEVSLVDPQGEAGLTYPIAEYGQLDPLLQRSAAATGIVVYRRNAIPALANLLLFGDNPSGEVFSVRADRLPSGGQDAIRRILFNNDGDAKTLLQLIQEKNREQGRSPARRADLRFGTGPDSQIFLLNKRDGTIRLLVP